MARDLLLGPALRAPRDDILEAADALGRSAPTWFGVNVWCGLDPDARRARELIGGQMEGLYKIPYDKFQHVAPAGDATAVAEWLGAFVDAGAEHITLIPVADTVDAGIDHAAKVRALLLDHVS